ncbi:MULTISPECIES: hypothetical protein [Pseudomonas]|uniref:hypothetical protein n=1 Tax=Pseudomonas TaxID=286 RepID=UPI0024547562|nr:MULTISPECIES: hypothetical protein [unclassified Pseudomonas]MDH4550439.1 hypothetical protein [Pseudomonas sp. BN607]
MSGQLKVTLFDQPAALHAGNPIHLKLQATPCKDSRVSGLRQPTGRLILDTPALMALEQGGDNGAHKDDPGAPCSTP